MIPSGSKRSGSQFCGIVTCCKSKPLPAEQSNDIIVYHMSAAVCVYRIRNKTVVQYRLVLRLRRRYRCLFNRYIAIIFHFPVKRRSTDFGFSNTDSRDITFRFIDSNNTRIHAAPFRFIIRYICGQNGCTKVCCLSFVQFNRTLTNIDTIRINRSYYSYDTFAENVASICRNCMYFHSAGVFCINKTRFGIYCCNFPIHTYPLYAFLRCISGIKHGFKLN